MISPRSVFRVMAGVVPASHRKIELVDPLGQARG